MEHSPFTLALQWPHAARHAAYLLQRTPRATLEMRTSFECVYGKRPDLSILRVFGSRATALLDEQIRQNKGLSKVDRRAVEVLYIGRCPTTHSDLLYEPKTRSVIRTGDINVIEDLDDCGRVLLNTGGGEHFVLRLLESES